MGASTSINRPQESSSPNISPPLDSAPMSDTAPKAQPEEPQSVTTEPSSAEPEIDEEDDEEEKGECGFCLFMKGGGCKESFVAWENCIEEAEKTNEDIAQKCFDLTSALRECMLAHSEYYEPILRAEKAAEEEAIKELDKEKDKDKDKDKDNEAVTEVESSKEASSEKQ